MRKWDRFARNRTRRLSHYSGNYLSRSETRLYGIKFAARLREQTRTYQSPRYQTFCRNILLIRKSLVSYLVKRITALGAHVFLCGLKCATEISCELRVIQITIIKIIIIIIACVNIFLLGETNIVQVRYRL